MKRLHQIRITVWITVGFMCLCACSKDFLTELPKDETYADNLYRDYSGFKLAKNALLHFPRNERRDMIQSIELGAFFKIGTDAVWANTELSWSRGLNRYNVELNPTMQLLNGDTEGSPGVFLILYQAINAANMLISRADNPYVDWQGANEEENLANKHDVVAHARLIRAWAYRHLVLAFGPVPLNVVEITGENYRDDWERNAVEDIQEQIEQDLLFAEEWLPSTSADITRLSSAIASHYLAELYLWQTRYSDAVEKARKVVENPNYQLITSRYGVRSGEPGVPFMDQFYHGNIMPSEGNTEALWVFPNTDADNVLGQYSNSMRRTWVSAYYNKNIDIKPIYGGRGLGRAALTSWVFSLYEPQDDRFSGYAIRKYYVDRSGDTIATQMEKNHMTNNNHLWASSRKWDWTYDDPDRYAHNFSLADQTYLRLAETYLLLAEALHFQGNNEEAAYYINQVRVRANATPVTSEYVTLDYILDERARELATEEHRRHTLVRTNTLIDRTKRYNHIASGERDGGAGIENHHVLLPIPQKVIEANVGRQMKQNDGYH